MTTEEVHPVGVCLRIRTDQEMAWFEICPRDGNYHAYGVTDTDVAAVDNGSSQLKADV
jgi:hypothetical protein